MKHNIEEILKNKLKMEDEFDFFCARCGKCCKDKETLIVTGLDLFRIAKQLNKTMEELIKDSCYVYVGDDSQLPIVSIKMRTYDNSCPFYRKGCTLGPDKPISCSIFPLGRMYDSRTQEYAYFKQQGVCGFKNKQTLKDYIKDINTEELNLASKSWGDALVDLAMYMRYIKEDKEKQYALNHIFIALYIYYDTKKDYKEQLENNLKILATKLKGFEVKN